ncbi:conserved hypothetical protein [Candidatus Terasakiella magnetica]|nr:conserved hypothetical protein [Candidatus Terasakiella magnetica]
MDARQKTVYHSAVFIGAGWSLGADLVVNSFSSWLMWKPSFMSCPDVEAVIDA